MQVSKLRLFIICLSATLLGQVAYADCNAILPGEYKTECIGPGESHCYSFWANAGDYVTVLMGEVGYAPSFAPEVELHMPDGKVVTNWGDESATILSERVGTSGTCIAVARDHWGHYSCCYGLTVIKNPGPNVNEPNEPSVKVTPGEYCRGTIKEGDMDAYEFRADVGDYVTVLMGEVGYAPSFAPEVELHMPDGKVVTNWGDESATILSERVGTSGTCIAVARDHWGHYSCGYGLTVIKNPGPNVNEPNDSLVPIKSGDNKAGTIREGDLDPYVFWSNEGDYVTVLMGEVGYAPSFAPEVELHTPDGNVVTSWGDASATILSERVGTSGTCIAVARDHWGHYSCGYGLSMSRVNAVGTPIVSSLSDNPDPVVQNNLLTLTASGVNDSDGWIVQVDFYRDLNRNGYLDLDGEDQLLGIDNNPAEGWDWTGTVGCFPPIGSNRYFARAMDNNGLWSDPKDCTGEVLPVYDADFTGDCRVDFFDLSIFGLYWLDDTCQSPDWCEGTDINHSDAVNLADLAIMAAEWLEGTVP